MSFYIRGIALRTTKDEKDYTDPNTGEVLPSYTTMVVDGNNYTRFINSNTKPELEANEEYIFPVSIFPFVDKKDKTKAKQFLKLRTEEEIKKAV